MRQIAVPKEIRLRDERIKTDGQPCPVSLITASDAVQRLSCRQSRHDCRDFAQMMLGNRPIHGGQFNTICDQVSHLTFPFSHQRFVSVKLLTNLVREGLEQMPGQGVDLIGAVDTVGIAYQRRLKLVRIDLPVDFDILIQISHLDQRQADRGAAQYLQRGLIWVCNDRSTSGLATSAILPRNTAARSTRSDCGCSRALSHSQP